VKEFAEAMVALGKGKTSEVPVKTQFGFHIIRVDDVRDAQLPKIEEVKPQIVQQLMQQKSSAYIEELRAKARIE
jgi:peptidyl-prolyl cis-trans isomerase C